MISAAAFCPHPPLLVPQVAGEAAAQVAPLLAACRTAVTRAAAHSGRITVLGVGARTAPHGPDAHGSLRGFGVAIDVGDATAPAELPLSLTVGAWLVREVLGAPADALWSIGPDGAAPHLGDQDTALLVMGDASARRTEKAPGYLDTRAAAFDHAIAHALKDGDAAALAGDLELGADLLAAGAPAWAAASTLLAGGRWDAELLYDGAPYGVGYLVAVWTARG